MGYCTYIHKTDEDKARELSAKVKEIWDRKMVLSDACLASTKDLEAELAEITKEYKTKISATREAFMKEHWTPNTARHGRKISAIVRSLRRSGTRIPIKSATMYVKQEGDFYCCTPNGYEDGPTSRYYLRVEDEGIIYKILDQYEKV